MNIQNFLPFIVEDETIRGTYARQYGTCRPRRDRYLQLLHELHDWARVRSIETWRRNSLLP